MDGEWLNLIANINSSHLNAQSVVSVSSNVPGISIGLTHLRVPSSFLRGSEAMTRLAVCDIRDGCQCLCGEVKKFAIGGGD